jgi:uncharacterized protein (TIGR03435 family)
MLTLNKASVIGVFAITSLLGQVDSSSTQPPFVASIKPSSDNEPTGFKTTRGRFLARGVTAKYLIAIAYGLQKFQILGGERWVDGDRFDVEAKLEAQSVGSGNEALMVKLLLADRFNLQVHQETRESPVYALVIAAGGPKIKAVSTQGGVNVREGILVSTGMPMGLVASLLGTRLGRTVIDRTNLEGRYAIDLRWTPEPGELPSDPGGTSPTPDLSGPSIFTAVQEQLGLKLLSTKGPSGFLVIDRIEKPPFE